jgi:glycosyltransferase involved in cell wall biosynthesis
LGLADKNWFRFFAYEPGTVLCGLFERYKFDLVLLHSIASLDDVDVVQALAHLSVPFAVVHHFDNRRLSHPLARMKMRSAGAIAGVSNVNVPRYLRGRFIQVREGIDTEFFRPEKAVPVSVGEGDSCVLLPARITLTKGQIDLVKALALMNERGVRAQLVFAGRTDSVDAMRALQSAIARLQDPGQVVMLGNLDKESLRKWYARCTLVAMPSHSEGLGRVLLEAQAMERPVVAYDVGGVSEAVRHGETGYLIKKGDIVGLTARLCELVQDPARRASMGSSGRRFVEEKFALLHLAETHEQLCLAALESAR